ncbi:MAG: hypothetical protein GF401_17665 [Chitinivibrionales bacterium]|nr:hypothetical protein [Chitinivibrionales bacterium]
MPKLVFNNLIGQNKVKEVLAAAFEKQILAHAYLFCGEEGTGKLQAAVELAMGLLCADTEQAPCYTCESCRKILHFAHPDLHFIFPVYLQSDQKDSEGISEKGWKHIAELSRKRINNPYVNPGSKGVPNIPVAWLHDVNHAILRGTIEGPMSVTIIDCVDMMNKASGNAMLKVLEEPPENTIMLLLTDKHHAVLPTIVSRCQSLRFGYVTNEQIRESISRLCSKPLSDEECEEAVRYAMGSVGRALFLLENPTTQWAEQASELFELCLNNNWMGIADVIDVLSARDNFDACEQVLIHFIYAVRERVMQRIEAPEKYITNKEHAIDPCVAEELFNSCRRAISAVRARGNTALVLVNFIMSIMEILNNG